MPDDALLFVDNGSSIIWGVHYFEIRRPHTFYIDLGLASMGAAVAGVVGGALAARGRRAVALVGDAAFAMNGFEVHTAVDEGLPVIWIVLNNHGHAMVNQGDKLMRGRDLGVSQFKHPLDAAAVARARGARGVRVTTPGELQHALVDAFAHGDGPTVIDAVVDPDEIPPTLVRRVQTLASFMSLNRPGDARCRSSAAERRLGPEGVEGVQIDGHRAALDDPTALEAVHDTVVAVELPAVARGRDPPPDDEVITVGRDGARLEAQRASAQGARALEHLQVRPHAARVTGERALAGDRVH